MAFFLFFACGSAGGVLGGMGMGGGTALIPLLTLLCGVPQRVAQGVNLVAFLPAAAAALAVHCKSGLIEKQNGPFLILPALLFSAGFSALAAFLPAAVLKKGFGCFLLVLSVFGARRALSGKKKDGRAKQGTKNFRFR